ncbi:outer membrane protein assembly factor [Bryocella elongata]|nr:outer membrane protein assembly factor [Bryocella elongata]
MSGPRSSGPKTALAREGSSLGAGKRQPVQAQAPQAPSAVALLASAALAFYAVSSVAQTAAPATSPTTTTLSGQAASSPALSNGAAGAVQSPGASAKAAQAASPEALPGPNSQSPAAAAAAANAPPPAPVVSNPLPALASSVWSRQGMMVKDIRFDGVTFPAGDPLPAKLTQKADQPLDAEKVRADLRRLFASGRYRDLAVNAEPNGDGLTLIFTGTPRYYVGRVTIVGVPNERLSSLFEFSTKLEPGTPFTESEIPAAVEGITDALKQNGYYQSTVAPTTATDVGQQVNATFKVTLGPQARVGDVAVDGTDAGITQEEFRKKGELNCSLLTHAFQPHCRPKVTRDTTSNALAGVRGYYQKKDRLEGTISLEDSTYAAQRRQIDYKFQAHQGPLVKVDVEGVKLPRSRVKLLVPIYEEGAVDIDLLNEGAFNIRDYLQQKGYFDVQDSVQVTGRDTPTVTVRYDVKPGLQHRVTDVTVKGNKYFDAELIEESLRVKKGDAYQRSGRYSTQLVNADASTIESLYRANGFTHVKVTSSVEDIDKTASGQTMKKPEIKVHFNVVEGAQQKFGDVTLSGVDEARQAEVKKLLSAESGQPFSLVTLSQDRDAVLSYYVSHGFDHARIELDQALSDDDATRTDVTFNVHEGRMVAIESVLLSGVVHTKPRLVDKQLKVHAGDPLNQSALLDTQRNLYNLALFSEVNAAVQNPTGQAPTKNVLVQLTEAKRWDVTYGFGFEAQTGIPSVTNGNKQGNTAAQNGQAGVSPRVSLDVSRINLRGTTQSLTLHSTYGLLERVATLTYNVPQFLGKPTLTASISGGYSNVQNITTFQASTLQGDFRVAQKIKRADNVIYDFLYRRISVNEDSLEITPNLVPQLSEPVTVGGPGITFFHDTRDPSPLDAQHGQYFSAQEFISYSTFGAETDFSRTDFSHSSYYTFGKRRKYTFARNLRVGFENFYGGTSGVSNLSSIGAIANCSGSLLYSNATCNPIPLPERLYAGGANSHRGFGINDAGPRDLTTGYPVGGSAVVVNTFELRLPPPVLPLVGDSVSFVFFHDMGNVFRYPSDMLKSIKNFRQPDKQTCENVSVPAGTTDVSTLTGTCSFNYYSHAIGMGARYKTPVGPIRVDFSYNLNPPTYPVYDDYTGAAPYVGRASHFNFFFGIGQTF